ncbi:hypothetical protein J0910_29820 [Nocardiopsis sp. CNT-189]|uniref:hypothetical protein n=1 Tax=Nocardiopsis oceanisediminis TaxID=2816862 RepID=UPI003B2CC80D
MSTLTMYDPGVEPVTRVRVLVGEDDDETRRDGKTAIAFSDCRYYCPDHKTAKRVIEALRDSDERLRARPEELMLWDWQSTYFEAETGDPQGGGTVLLGVAWYDEDFYTERKGAWFGAMHKRIYTELGVPLENVEVTHWRRDAA